MKNEAEAIIKRYAEPLAAFYAANGWQWSDAEWRRYTPSAEQIADTLRHLAESAAASACGWASSGRLRACYDEGALWFAVELEADDEQ